MFILISMIVFFVGFYFCEKINAWENYCLKVEKDKHWHFEVALFGTLWALNVELMYNLWWWVVPILAIGVSISKELWDATHGQFFDWNDLKADLLGIMGAYLIHYWYLISWFMIYRR